MRHWLKSFLSKEAAEEGCTEGPERGCPRALVVVGL